MIVGIDVIVHSVSGTASSEVVLGSPTRILFYHTT